MAKVRKKALEDGRILVVREDGSTYIADPKTQTTQELSGPNPLMAEAFGVNDTSAMDEQLAAQEAYFNSPWGQRNERLIQEAYDENVRQFNVGAGTNRYNAETNRQQANTSQYSAETGRYSAETNRMDTEARIAELERRYGLDVAKFGTDYVKTSIEYAKTPRSWVDSVMWEAGATPIYQNIAAGKQLPAFGAKGNANSMPGMNSMTDTMSTLGFTNAGEQFDPAKAIQQVIKAVPPGQLSASGTMSPAEVGVINLARDLYQAGGTNVAEGRWESASPEAQQTLLGAMDYMAPGGGDRYLRNLQMTRIPGRSNVNAA